jgi:hypothetical protein
MVKDMIAKGVKCELGPVLKLAGVPEAKSCRKKVEGIHERRKRSSGGSLTNPQNLMGACNICNEIVERNKELSRSLGLVVRPGDPEWDSLGGRSDVK